MPHAHGAMAVRWLSFRFDLGLIVNTANAPTIWITKTGRSNRAPTASARLLMYMAASVGATHSGTDEGATRRRMVMRVKLVQGDDGSAVIEAVEDSDDMLR